MLTLRDIANLPGLGLELAAGGGGVDNPIRWVQHRHTLRYRIDQRRKQTGRDPDDPAQRMELWLAIKAKQALAARGAKPAPV